MFPEYRWEFFVNIERMTTDGPARGEVRLGDVVNGDHLTKATLTLYDQRLFGGPPPNPTAKETVSISKTELGRFDFLMDVRASQTESIKGKELYFCRVFSIVGLPHPEIVPGVRFLTMRDFHATDCLQIIAAHRAQQTDNVERFKAAGIVLPAHHITLPKDASGIFVVDLSVVGSKAHADALVGRLLAAVALASGVSGQITLQMNIEDERFSSHMRSEQWSRPYQKADGVWQNVVWADNAVMGILIKLIASSSEKQFVTGKEDFRLLAIDTVEDSRRPGVAVLQLAQLWMAIERLLAFQNETTMQLALALSALSPANERIEAFRALKKSYQLRSRIVHGYSFRRDDSIYAEIQKYAAIFRQVLALSLEPDMNTGETLRTAMVSHVLSGAKAAMSVSPR